MTKERPEPIAHLAKVARGALEAVLDRLDWPASELAFHRCIDRLIQLEESDRAKRR
jgi:hypothetical protein